MKVLLRDGQRTIELRRRQDCGASESVMQFGNPDLALLLLRRCKSDPGSMALLRRFVAYHSGQTNLKRMNDHQVLQFLARSISDQQVKVVLHKGSAAPLKGGSAQPAVSKPAPPQASVARPAPPAPVKPIPAPPPIEEAVFVPVDAAMQAATLKSAAQTGAPFCEECAKARSA